MSYKKVDINNWKRKDHYNYLVNVHPTRITITKDIDITEFFEVIRDNDLKFSPTVYYCLGVVFNQMEAFKYSHINGELVLFDKINPFYTVFHKDTELYSNVWTTFEYDYEKFIANYTDDMNNYKDCNELMPKPRTEPGCYFISNLPWTTCNSLNLDEEKYNVITPRIFLTRRYEKDDRIYLPVTLLFNHATCDGFHLCQFMNAFQNLVNEFNPEFKGKYALNTNCIEEIRI